MVLFGYGNGWFLWTVSHKYTGCDLLRLAKDKALGCR